MAVPVPYLCRDCGFASLVEPVNKNAGKRCKLDNIALFVGEFGSRCTLG